MSNNFFQTLVRNLLKSNMIATFVGFFFWSVAYMVYINHQKFSLKLKMFCRIIWAKSKTQNYKSQSLCHGRDWKMWKIYQFSWGVSLLMFFNSFIDSITILLDKMWKISRKKTRKKVATKKIQRENGASKTTPENIGWKINALKKNAPQKQRLKITLQKNDAWIIDGRKITLRKKNACKCY